MALDNVRVRDQVITRDGRIGRVVVVGMTYLIALMSGGTSERIVRDDVAMFAPPDADISAMMAMERLVSLALAE